MAGFPLCDAAPGVRRPGRPALPRPDDRLPRLRPTLELVARHDPLTGEAALATPGACSPTGAIVAVKGLGGYHLVVRATNGARSRAAARKRRGDKPFAIMVRDLAAARALVDIDPGEAELLTGPRRPVVLLPRGTPSRLVTRRVAPRKPAPRVCCCPTHRCTRCCSGCR
jgi:hydrogenase maturation protein HypF